MLLLLDAGGYTVEVVCLNDEGHRLCHPMSLQRGGVARDMCASFFAHLKDADFARFLKEVEKPESMVKVEEAVNAWAETLLDPIDDKGTTMLDVAMFRLYDVKGGTDPEQALYLLDSDLQEIATQLGGDIKKLGNVDPDVLSLHIELPDFVAHHNWETAVVRLWNFLIPLLRHIRSILQVTITTRAAD